MPSFTGINHLAMVTGDMDRTIRFWRDLLGMRLVAGLGGKGYRHYFFQICDRDMIAFFEWPGAKKIAEKDHGVPVNGPAAFDHIAFGVEGEDDLWDLKDRLEAAGFWVSEVIDHGFIHSIYTFDPNNIPIEFSSPVNGVDLRAQPKMLDRHPGIVAREGPEPRPGKWPAVVRTTPEEERMVFPGEGMVFVDNDDPTA
ncbi:glyoxalase [Desulfosarcina alkanivorans]|jgi:catechol 2,3-dioxygenase-like lactoylglutathione lyase family enzyme|uniref:Glyoxalase n=1 Tax=Desulfosarcina alkanivorans TaxID=571177 RepID=A0A5K7YQL6_9BACT|nr:VOC family protein [Desulfosarcina alkanivorans]BBO69261.1 glyoxalase [Desulfosarcina alkanivorans]